MAFFGVTIEEIEEIKPHPNADRLEIASLCGMNFQFCVEKGKWKNGMKCLYFSIDSLFPFELMEVMKLTKKVKNKEGIYEDRGMLSGKEYNRLKTARLRDVISQGLIGPLSLIDGLKEVTSETITEFLGIKKYEPPAIPCHNADLHKLPSELSVYDIEGADRFSEIAKKIMDRKVWVTEKIEGQNFSVTFRPKTDEFFVNQRNYTIIPKDGNIHTFWKIANDLKLYDSLKEHYQDFESITLYGEAIGPGIQKNIYSLRGHTVLFFDVKVDGNFLNVKNKIEILKELGLIKRNIVPRLGIDVILREWLNGKTIQEASNGHTILNDSNIYREGIVITPMEEDRDESIGRLVLKQRSSLYLERE